MRVTVMGTGGFAVPMFQAILAAGHCVPLLVTRPVPAPTGRKKEQLHPNPMRDFAESHAIPVIAPASTSQSEAIAQLKAEQPDLFVVCDFGEILSKETLAIAPLGGINLHASLLPKYRGAAPINWAILRGETHTGVSVIHMTPQLDGGPVLASSVTAIGEQETSAELEPRLAQLGIEPVLRSIDMLAHWDRKSMLGTLQIPEAVTSARRLRKSDGNVNWSRSAKSMVNQVRGLQPWPGVFSHWLREGSSPLRVLFGKVVALPQADFHPQEPGTIVDLQNDHVFVQTGDGLLSLEVVQPAGKRLMAIAEFLRGNVLNRVGRFGNVE